MNLAAYVEAPFTAAARLDVASLSTDVATAARMLDNVIDLSRFPLPAQREQAHGSRRLGLGFTGLGDALVMLGIRYDSGPGRRCAADWMRAICHAAYRASVALARERGAFGFFDRDRYLAAPFVAALPPDIREGIAREGIRNSHLTAVAPTGTISLVADNVSGGIEPVFSAEYRRRVRDTDGSWQEHRVVDYAVARWRELRGDEGLPPAFVDAHQVAPEEHLAMQAAVQPYVDSAVSKTVNVPRHIDLEAFAAIYERAHRMGLKGCTTFRPNAVTGQVLDSRPDRDDACCTV
jgi:ribonucleoside-diphosphate reductase alpha chain